jgi:hypothetical protein
MLPKLKMLTPATEKKSVLHGIAPVAS